MLLQILSLGKTLLIPDKEKVGTKIVLTLKEDSEEEHYSEFLEEYRIKSLVKKHSDYLRYPIKMECTHERKKEKDENQKDDQNKEDYSDEDLSDLTIMNEEEMENE